MIGYEYELVGGNKIKGWRITKNPTTEQDLEKNSPPLENMNIRRRDGSRALLSDNNKNFILNPDGTISEVDHVETECERIKKKYTTDKKIRILMKAVRNPNDPEFLAMENDLN